MIKVQDLTKIYKSKDRTNCVALDRVSFTLPDSGMVFVLGKSGSGKSTLLNLLGGLDSFDGGEILFENERLSAFSKYDFYDYRCRHIGFVFQDFHLLEELTVEENIALVLDLESAGHKDLITTALARVGMEQYASRYPRELSGGQKQRVAMARAIVKSPEVILCDEPTGNLDAENSRQILELLKEFSKTKLVIIVSHNLHDAEEYADRILELLDGKIMRDEERRPYYINEFGINEGTLMLPYNKTLSQEQIGDMMQGIRSGEVQTIVQNDNGFYKTAPIEHRGRPYSRRNAGMSFQKTMDLTRTMMRGKVKRFWITAITATLIVSCFAVFQSFLNYSVNTSLSHAMMEDDFPVMAYQKAMVSGSVNMLNTTSLIYINDDDFRVFQNTKYGDRMHVLYDHALPVLPNMGDVIGSKTSRDPLANVSDFYIGETYGVLQCDRALVEKIFGGDIRVLAGDISCPNRGIIITDYVADSILVGNPTQYQNYDSIIGVYRSPMDKRYGVIDAIIETGYKEKYGDLKARMDALNANGDEEGLAELRDSDEFWCFAEQVQLVLGISYTFSSDYIADMSSSTDFLELGIPGKLGFDIGGEIYRPNNSPRVYCAADYEMETDPGQAVFPVTLFNSIAGTTYSAKDLDTFVPTDVTVTFYARDGEVIGTRTVRVSALTAKQPAGIFLNESDFLAARPLMTIPYAIYFDDVNAAKVLDDIAADHNFVVRNVESDTATRLNRLIITFSDLFRLFEGFLLAICVIYLAAFGSNIIQRHKYQIGIIKSLGGKTSQIARIFLAQLLVVGGFIFALSGVGIWAATSVANAILLNSMRTHMELQIHHFDIIEFFPHLAIIDLCLVVLITIVSSLAPLWAIHNIKPINIIKAKE